MDKGPSLTAVAAAMHRAAHQRLDGGRYFVDRYAMAILPEQFRQRVDRWAQQRGQLPMRTFIAQRSGIAEARMADAVARGTRQLVIVGAGLDTLALRNPFPDVEIYEVDHPATQDWKRQHLEFMGATPPANLHYAGCDLEVDGLVEALQRAGFDPSRPACFSWLGVTCYLTEPAIFATLGTIAALPGAEVSFDYFNPIEALPPALREVEEHRARRVIELGEPFRSSFVTDQLAQRLQALSPISIEDWGPHRLTQSDHDLGWHVVHVRWP
jgi:methyltransferase (TIGR00027 family)